MVPVNWGFHMQKNFSKNYPQFGHAFTKIFPAVLVWKRLKNIAFKELPVINPLGCPHVLGQLCCHISTILYSKDHGILIPIAFFILFKNIFSEKERWDLIASERGLKCLWKSVTIMTPLLSEIVRGRQKSQNKLGEIPLPSLTLVFSTFKHCQSVSLSNLKVIHQNQLLYPSNRTYILMVVVLSSCFLIHSLTMVYWKLKYVSVAAVYTTTI